MWVGLEVGWSKVYRKQSADVLEMDGCEEAPRRDVRRWRLLLRQYNRLRSVVKREATRGPAVERGAVESNGSDTFALVIHAVADRVGDKSAITQVETG